MFLHKCDIHCRFVFKSYDKLIELNLFFIHLILFWIDELIHLYSKPYEQTR